MDQCVFCQGSVDRHTYQCQQCGRIQPPSAPSQPATAEVPPGMPAQTCPCCGEGLPPRARFCPYCAQPLTPFLDKALSTPLAPATTAFTGVAAIPGTSGSPMTAVPGLPIGSQDGMPQGPQSPASPQQGVPNVPNEPGGPQQGVPAKHVISTGQTNGGVGMPGASGGRVPSQDGPVQRAGNRSSTRNLRKMLLGTTTAKLISALVAVAIVSAGSTAVIVAIKGGAARFGGTQPRQPAGIITEFSVPIGNEGLGGITTGPDGNLWFTEFDRIGRITPAGQATVFPVPGANDLERITAGPDKNLWFPDGPYFYGQYPVESYIDRITPTGKITKFPLPFSSTSGTNPGAITAGPDGNLWFTECTYFYPPNSNLPDVQGCGIGRITPAGQATVFPVPDANGFESITAGPDKNLWFIEGTDEFGRSSIGRITPAGKITEFPVPTDNSLPNAITAGPDGNLWFMEKYADQIGRITPAGQITESPLPTSREAPQDIIAGPDGNLWFTECILVLSNSCESSKIGRITPTGIVTEFPLPNSNSIPSSITAGPDGNLWFTESGGGKIGRITSGK